MQGGYHGAQESTLVEGEADHPRPSTAGIPQSFAEHTLPVPFNDPEAARELFEAHGEDIAAVITEPILGNNGIVMPVEGYHETLRELCDDYGSLLIFDEVITGFRVGGLQCAQGKFGITPDLTTFGNDRRRRLSRGCSRRPCGAYRAVFASGEVFQSGTFSGHPVTMAAGLKTLEYAAENDVYDHINTLAETLRSGLVDPL